MCNIICSMRYAIPMQQGCRRSSGAGHCTKQRASIGKLLHKALTKLGFPQGDKDKASKVIAMSRPRPSAKTEFKLEAPSTEELNSPIKISICKSKHPADRNLFNATHAMAAVFDAHVKLGKPIRLEMVVKKLEEALKKLAKPIIAEKHIPALAKAIIGQDNRSYLVHYDYESSVKQALDKIALNGVNGETVFETAVKSFGPWFIGLNKELPANLKVADLIPKVLAHKRYQDANDTNHKSAASLVKSAYQATAA